MVVHGCSSGGHLDDSKFSEPMPWIGIYVAAASFAIAVAMAADAIRGIRYWKLWFPCKFFSLNATSLTLITVAVKLSVDLNTSMPERHDQLAKLSSGVLMCTVMGNFMPSIGTMDNKEIVMSIVALGILVVTLVVNICTQMVTGAIYVFWKEHIFIMFLMLLLFVVLSFSALTVPTTKQFFELKYRKKCDIAMKECAYECRKSIAEKLNDDLMKFWMMAHTCCPQFVMGRSVTCIASGAFCLLGAVSLTESMIQSYLLPQSFNFCSGHSDYQWSTSLILVTQVLAVGVGTIAPAFRWFIAIKYNCPLKKSKGLKKEFQLEKYWIQLLIELKECPLTLGVRDRRIRKVVHDLKTKVLDFCIGTQAAIVFLSKLVRLISVLFFGQILLCLHYCKRLKEKITPNNTISNSESGSESHESGKMGLSRFVLYLEGEEELVELMLRNKYDATGHWIRMGKKKEPKHLIQLLERCNCSLGFIGVREFDSHQVPSLDCAEPQNCWGLPVVTLASIAIALPGIDKHLIKQLTLSVNQGLMYVRCIEDNLDKKEKLNIRKAADVLWLGVELYQRWVDVDLCEMAREKNHPKEVLDEFASIAKTRYAELKNSMPGWLRDRPSRWPVKLLAANSMYRISKTILLDYESGNCQTSEKLFQKISVMISDILGACLTNLKHIILMKCHNSRIEEREDSVQHAIFLLGKCEKILKILDLTTLPCSIPDQVSCIEEWRLSGEKSNQLSRFPRSTYCDSVPFAVAEVHLPVE